MKIFSRLILIIAVTYVSIGCGASNAQKKDATPTPSSAPEKAAVNSGNNSQVRTMSNISTGIPNINAGTGNSISGPSTAAPDVSIKSEIGRARTRGDRVDVNPAAPAPPPTFQAAPENSEFAVQMEKGGGVIETRVYKSHPQLKKVEIRWLDPQTKSLKVILRNGNIIERKSVTIANLRTISSAEILNLVGVKPSQK